MKTPPATITVIQGEFAVSSDATVKMSTVLGSCVAVCMYDPVNKVGGMNHFLLATSATPQNSDLKYGVNAMELLINRLLNSGAERCNLAAKLFGGARMMNLALDIGATNASFAVDFLAKERIVCTGSSLGGTSARRIEFVPTTGAARQMQISGTPEEQAYRPKPTTPSQDITLF